MLKRFSLPCVSQQPDPNSKMKQTNKNGNKILIDGLGIVLGQFLDSDSEESIC